MASKKRSGLALLMEQLEAAETKLASKKAKLDVEVKEVNRQKEELRNAVIAKAAEDGIDPKFVVETKFGRRSLSATPTTVVSALDAEQLKLVLLRESIEEALREVLADEDVEHIPILQGKGNWSAVRALAITIIDRMPWLEAFAAPSAVKVNGFLETGDLVGDAAERVGRLLARSQRPGFYIRKVK